MHDSTRPGRRRALSALGALALSACTSRPWHPPEAGPVAAMFPGAIDDGGFVAAGYRGLIRAEREFGIPVEHVADVPPERERMLAELRRLASSNATLVIGFGAAASEPLQRVAWEFPEQRFVSVQGTLTRPNLAVYAVLPEQSAWLAGALAGLLTKTNVVGHLAGDRSDLAQHMRAGFSAGLTTTRPQARLLSTFTGSADDATRARSVALAQIDAGADVLFAMLGAGGSGATTACLERGVKQIGAVRDWVTAMPDAFVAAAVADPGYALYMAVRDLRDNLLRGDLVKHYGVHYPEAVRLALGDGVPAGTKAPLERYRERMAAGGIEIPATYNGAEFAPA
ncbi:MAG: BMP family protein [Betaproteobacteria bacterium]|nr:BMP family protein [Betaproteobacteria bacterium]